MQSWQLGGAEQEVDNSFIHHSDNYVTDEKNAVCTIAKNVFNLDLTPGSIKELGKGSQAHVYDFGNNYCVKVHKQNSGFYGNPIRPELESYKNYIEASKKYSNPLFQVVVPQKMEECEKDAFTLEFENMDKLTFFIFEIVQGTQLAEKLDDKKAILKFCDLYKDFVNKTGVRHCDLHFVNIFECEGAGYKLIDLDGNSLDNGDVDHLATRYAGFLHYEKNNDLEISKISASTISLFSFDSYDEFYNYFNRSECRDRCKRPISNCVGINEMKAFLLNFLHNGTDDVHEKLTMEACIGLNIGNDTYSTLFKKCKSILKNKYDIEKNTEKIDDAEFSELRHRLENIVKT